MMLLMLSAAMLVAADPVATPAPPAAPAPAKRERLVCKSFEITGSRMGRDRVCKTADEWRMEETQRNHEVEEAQRAAASQR